MCHSQDIGAQLAKKKERRLNKTDICIYPYLYIYMCAPALCIYIYVCACACAHLHGPAHAHLHMYVCVYIYIFYSIPNGNCLFIHATISICSSNRDSICQCRFAPVRNGFDFENPSTNKLYIRKSNLTNFELNSICVRISIGFCECPTIESVWKMDHHWV